MVVVLHGVSLSRHATVPRHYHSACRYHHLAVQLIPPRYSMQIAPCFLDRSYAIHIHIIHSHASIRLTLRFHPTPGLWAPFSAISQLFAGSHRKTVKKHVSPHPLPSPSPSPPPPPSSPASTTANPPHQPSSPSNTIIPPLPPSLLPYTPYHDIITVIVPPYPLPLTPQPKPSLPSPPLTSIPSHPIPYPSHPIHSPCPSRPRCTTPTQSNHEPTLLPRNNHQLTSVRSEIFIRHRMALRGWEMGGAASKEGESEGGAVFC